MARGFGPWDGRRVDGSIHHLLVVVGIDQILGLLQGTLNVLSVGFHGLLKVCYLHMPSFLSLPTIMGFRG